MIRDETANNIIKRGIFTKLEDVLSTLEFNQIEYFTITIQGKNEAPSGDIQLTTKIYASVHFQ